MASKKAKAGRARVGRGGGFLPAFCNVLGVLMLVAIIGLCAPLTLPLVAGYQVFDVISGSMEPEIPVGSVVYVKAANPSEIQEGEIIAFHEDDGVVVHRVVVNRNSLAEFVTMGDANNVEDFEPIPYEAVIGRVETHVPALGAFMAIYASTMGKVYLLLAAACGVMLNMVASNMRSSRRERELERELAELSQGAKAAQNPESSQVEAYSRDSGNYSSDQRSQAAARKPAKRRWGILRGVLVCVLAVAFLGSAGVVGYVKWQYSVSDALYSDAMDKYQEDAVSASAEQPPITIDFEALCAANPDVIGWIYCPGTVINYPVLQGKDNDQYLHHDYTGTYNINGSIFVDAGNAPKFADSNTIIYGHHMNSGSMFASLEKWGERSYYEEHPIMWLLTPTQNYKVVLFSAHHVNAYSNMYEIIHRPGEELAVLLGESLVESDLNANAQLDPELTKMATAKGVDLSQVQTDDKAPYVLLDSKSHYVMLSTCAYLFDNDRYVLHGKLVPVK